MSDKAMFLGCLVYIASENGSGEKPVRRPGTVNFGCFAHILQNHIHTRLKHVFVIMSVFIFTILW